MTKCDDETNYSVYFKPSLDNYDDTIAPFSEKIPLEKNPVDVKKIYLIDEILVYESNEGVEVLVLDLDAALVKKVDYFTTKEKNFKFKNFELFSHHKMLVVIFDIDGKIRILDLSKKAIEDPNQRIVVDSFLNKQRKYIITDISRIEKKRTNFFDNRNF